MIGGYFPAAIERDLRNLIRLMDAREAERLKVPVPTGLLLVGPAGTGKTSIAHLISTQTRRSFYAIAPADAPTPEKLAQVFARAREHSPSILFIDEIDGLLPRGDSGYFMGQHQIQLVEQALMLMSQLDPGNQVFLVGTFPEKQGRRVQELTILTVLEDAQGNFIAGKQSVIDLALIPATLAEKMKGGIHAATSFPVARPGFYRVRGVIREAVQDHTWASGAAVEVH